VSALADIRVGWAEPRVGGLAEFAAFVDAFGALVDRTDNERRILREGDALLARLVAVDDWLPDSHAEPDPARYRQYLLHLDPAGRFSVVSFVWGPGQATPVHDHRVWGLVGVLRGAELSERFERASGGLHSLGTARLEAGAVEAVSPRIGDIHRVSNAHADRVSLSIHVYGADIGRVERATYDADGRQKPFISGYADRPPLAIRDLPR
jgi:predicted metal-dependent enzyme (double-stranded beta helix superfamily)